MKDILESMLNQICGANLFSSIYETLSVNLFSSGGAFGTAYNVVHAIYNTIMSIGVMLLFVYFIVALVDKLSSDTFTWETLWRQFALLLAAKYIMENGFQLLEIIFNIGMATAARVSALGDPSVSETAVDAAAIIDKFTGSFTGFFAIIGELIMMLYLLIPWLLSWIMGLCVSIICYSRVIEIYVRATFAPIALSDFFHSGLHGSGWRYLKSFLAVALQAMTRSPFWTVQRKSSSCMIVWNHHSSLRMTRIPPAPGTGIFGSSEISMRFRAALIPLPIL